MFTTDIPQTKITIRAILTSNSDPVFASPPMDQIYIKKTSYLNIDKNMFIMFEPCFSLSTIGAYQLMCCHLDYIFIIVIMSIYYIVVC